MIGDKDSIAAVLESIAARTGTARRGDRNDRSRAATARTSSRSSRRSPRPGPGRIQDRRVGLPSVRFRCQLPAARHR